MLPGISIIIPSYNGLELLKKCLPPLIEETRKYEGETEIIVVDDAGNDGTSEQIPNIFPQVSVLRNAENIGFAKSVNTAVRRSHFPLIFLLNNDMEITVPLLAPLAEPFKDIRVFGVQAKIMSSSEDEKTDYLNEFTQIPGFFIYKYRKSVVKLNKPTEMDFVSGGCSVIDKTKFIALGMFDERFSPVYFEDIDICFHARLFGWKMIYNPDAKVYHRHPASTVDRKYSPSKKRLIFKKNYFHFLLKNLLFFRCPCLYLLSLPMYLILKAVCGDLSFSAGLVVALKELASGKNTIRGGNKNVVYLDTPIPPPGGGQKSLLGILSNIKSFQPFLLSDADSEVTRFALNSAIPFHQIKITKLNFSWSSVRGYRLVSIINPSVVHCNSPASFYTFTFAFISKVLRIPFIWHARVIESAGWKERLICRLCDRIIVTSDAVGKKFRRYGTSDKFIKIYNAVDTRIFRPGMDTALLRSELALDGSGVMIGIFSRLDWWKGHELLFSAIRRMSDKIPSNKLLFLIVGDGPEKSNLNKLADSFGIREKIIFTGLRNNIPELMNLCDVIVNPSVKPEPFGRVVIEAMACGKTVIATDIGGHKEIIADGVDGLLVKPDADALADTILRAASDPKLRSMISANARTKVLSQFDIGNHVMRLESIYTELLKDTFIKETGLSCKICGNTSFRKVKGTAGPIKMLECLNCGIQFIYPIPEGFSARGHYDSAYYGAWEQGQKKARIKLWNRRLKDMMKYASLGKLLDVGAGTGLFLSTAKEHGFEVYGTEISPDACKISKDTYQIELFNGELAEANFPGGTFDIVTIWHVLEHLIDPGKMMQEIHRILKPGGMLAIALPNLKNYPMQFLYPVVTGKKYHPFTPEDRELHFFYFNERSLRNMLRLNAFNVLAIKPDMGQVTLGKVFLDIAASISYLLFGKISTEAFKAYARK
jgi:glycosyltransferase involved in cell wall biosynthesis/2-polyprenyl-3-methyl-5-hydroxy-6-metoxy-1,4-benzoquinol methylase